MRISIDGRSAFSIFFALIILAVFAYWYFTRPTQQERAVTDFFDNIRRGNAQEASEYLINSHYGQFLFESVITDSDGNDLKKGIKNDAAYLDELAWSYIPAARGHVLRFDAESLQTQKPESDLDVAFVVFKYKFTVKEFFDEPSHPGTVEGKMELRRIDKKWLIKRGDFKISIEGITIRNYWEE